MFFFRIWLALKQLVDKSQFEKLRFWGKILGTEKNYYVAEVEQNADEEVEEEEENEENNENDDKDADEDEEGEGEEDPLPKSAFKPPPTVPKEERGTGVNKHSYYVCNRRMYYGKEEFGHRNICFVLFSWSTMGSITDCDASTNFVSSTNQSFLHWRFDSRNQVISCVSRNRKALFTRTNCSNQCNNTGVT